MDAVAFRFRRFEKSDESRAVFALDVGSRRNSELFFRALCYRLGYRDDDFSMSRLRKFLRQREVELSPTRIGKRCSDPTGVFSVQIGDCVSDVAIVNFNVDTTFLEVTLDWKPTLTSFLRPSSVKYKKILLVSKRPMIPLPCSQLKRCRILTREGSYSRPRKPLEK